MNKPRFATLEQWLTWQETLHPKIIDLGLERVKRVAQRLGLASPSHRVITVGGTNGKGSSVAFLETILRAAGYRVGTYTSPHLLRYNERIRIDGQAVDDAALCQAFARIDAMRGEISLTYFEFGTLAALDLLQRADIQVAVLEVGMGGRLDAVNILDADAALITTIDIDHAEWLGSDRNSIGFEKAGIYRRGRPAICADPAPPEGLLHYADTIGARLYRVNQDYGFVRRGQEWTWWHDKTCLSSLPLPLLPGEHQLSNAAAVLMTLTSLARRLPIAHEAICAGLRQASIAARFQVISGPVEWILDVAHNVQGASTLARCLATRQSTGRTHGVLGMLSDKDAVGVALALDKAVDRWYTATLPDPRGQSGEQLARILRTGGIVRPISAFASVEEACHTAARESIAGDRVVVFGSFHTVARVLNTDFTAWMAPLAKNETRGTPVWITD